LFELREGASVRGDTVGAGGDGGSAGFWGYGDGEVAGEQEAEGYNDRYGYIRVLHGEDTEKIQIEHHILQNMFSRVLASLEEQSRKKL